ncbi:putative bifunctional diguanylate cyclase/phosphodiesterase [Marinobacter sp. C2H3]|uniref:putative bifunctional diguanylate cyclase/phosphodiesterase n=1 Tax=Marinobacter sp. C2H3 TaxID=3119003 RepID=UPI00300F2FD7
MRRLGRLGFRGRLITAMVALVVVVVLVIGALMAAYLFDDEKKRAVEQLDIGARVTQEVLQRRADLERSRLQVVVQDFGFLSAIASGDRATLISALDNHSERAGADLAVLLDTEGQVIASTVRLGRFPLPDGLLDRAGNGRELVAFRGTGYELLVVPVQAPGLRAWLVAGFRLDDALARIIAELSGTRVEFQTAMDDKASTFATFAASHLGGTREDVSDQRFFVRRIALGDSDPASDLHATLMVDRQASLQRYYQRAREIGLLVLAILVFAILVAMIIARTLSRPVRQLAEYARAIGRVHTGDADATPPRLRVGGELLQLRNTLRDTFTRLRDREAHIRHAATHDDVTGLANRIALLDALEERLVANQPCSLIGLRLNDLSRINDSLGLAFGDQVLTAVANRLREHWPTALVVARTGGREFLLLLERLSDAAQVDAARRLHRQLQTPLEIDHTSFTVRTSVVTLQLPDDAGTLNEFRRRVNLTFERAARSDDPVLRYRPGLDENHLRRLQIIGDLQGAIRQGQLAMHYQPKLDVSLGRLVQVEALVRWQHPSLGPVSPDEFISLAEQSGQIHDLTGHILQRVADDARGWIAQGLDIGIAINLSAKDLTWPALPGLVARTFADWPQPMSRITLEVTESALMDDPVRALETLAQLSALGVHLSVDDFGTGYSSLAQLRQLPVQELKIDKSFVLRLRSEPDDQLIVRFIIDMAHGLGLAVAAEGIEDLDSWHLLRGWGCNLAQGFALGRPMPAADLPGAAQTLHQQRANLTHNATENSG